MIVGDRWKVAIVQHLMHGPQKFSDLKQNIRYVSYRVLLGELSRREETGILAKQNHQKVLREAEYSLTEKGQDLQMVFDAMLKWADTYPQ